MRLCWDPIKADILEKKAAFDTSLSQGQLSNFYPQPVFFYCFNTYSNQFLTLSSLNQELLLNNTLITLKVPQNMEAASAQQTGISDSQLHVLSLSKNTLSLQKIQVEAIEPKELKRTRQSINNDSDQDSYVPEEEPEKKNISTVRNQTKNVPKNYGQAIIIFIQHNQSYVQKVLTQQNICYKQFMKAIKQIKRKLKSIRELRALWLDEDNPYAKAFRIITFEYLRKHCLPYIFNSRVQNFHNYIKYRYRIIESVKNPQNFTAVKEF